MCDGGADSGGDCSAYSDVENDEYSGETSSGGSGRGRRDRNIRLLECGEVIDELNNSRRIGLAPLPATTGFNAKYNSTLLSKNASPLIGFCTFNGAYSNLQFYIWSRVVSLAILLGLTCFAVYMQDRFLALFPVPLILMLGASLWWWLEQKSVALEARNLLPQYFHAQRKEVLFSKMEKKPEAPNFHSSFLNMSLAGCAYFFFVMGGILCVEQIDAHFLFLVFERQGELDLNSVVFGVVLLLLGAFFSALLAMIWRTYFQQAKRFFNDVELLAVPWEKVAIEYQYLTVLTSYGPKPTECLLINPIKAYWPKDKLKQGISPIILPVNSEADAFSLYEFIRQHMDSSDMNNHSHIVDKRISREEIFLIKNISVKNKTSVKIDDIAGYNRSGYKRLLEHRKQSNGKYYFLWRLWYWFSLRYLTHVMLEYQHDIWPEAVRNRTDVKAWSAAIPESEWQAASDELIDLNQKLTDLYVQGHRWEGEPVQILLANHRENKNIHFEYEDTEQNEFDTHMAEQKSEMLIDSLNE